MHLGTVTSKKESVIPVLSMFTAGFGSFEERWKSEKQYSFLQLVTPENGWLLNSLPGP